MIRLLIFTVGLGLVIGCGVKTVPVTSNEKTSIKKDSTALITKKDSVYESHTETVSEKTLAGATTGITLTERDLNSLPVVLAQLPQGHQQIVVQDSKLKAQLRIYKDSLNQIHIDCQARDQHYYEKSVKDEKYISSLVNELTKVKEENSRLSETVKKLKISFWEKVKRFLVDGYHWLIIVIVIAIVLTVLLKIKSFRPL